MQGARTRVRMIWMHMAGPSAPQEQRRVEPRIVNAVDPTRGIEKEREVRSRALRTPVDATTRVITQSCPYLLAGSGCGGFMQPYVGTSIWHLLCVNIKESS